MVDPNAPTLLHRFLAWEREQPQAIYLTQPQPDGRVIDYTWAKVGEQARRMAAHLQSLQFPPRSQIALLGKDSAHWIIADLAIMMAGHVSVPLLSRLIKRRILRGLGLDQTRIAVTGSASLPSDIIDWYRSLGLELLDVYGMTSTA
ncbi:MAG: AMP-binding protein [Rhodanobacter sp.]